MDKLKELFLEFFKNFAKENSVELKDGELEKQIEEILKNNTPEIDLSKLDLSKLGADNPVLKAILDQNATLTQSVKMLQDTLGKEQQDRENARKVAEDQAKKDHEKKINDCLDKAEKEGKFSKSEREDWKAKLEKDFEMASEFLGGMPVKKQFKSDEDDKSNEDKSPSGKGSSYADDLSKAKEFLTESTTQSERI